MMKTTKTLISISFVLLLVASSLMVLSAPAETGMALGVPTRATGDNLVIENETFTIDKTSSPDDRSWDKIEIKDDGVLRIIGTLVVAKMIICKEDALNTSFIMENDGNLKAQLTVQEGIFSIKADEIYLKGASLTVSNSTETLPFGDNGHSSVMTLISHKSDLIINDTTLNVQGQAGAAGGPSNNGGTGGSATVTLEAQNGYKVNISGSDIQAFGGKGGDALASGWRAGTGGRVEFYTRSDQVEVRYTKIHGKSGNAGSAGTTSIGNTGGNCQLYIVSITKDLILSHSEMISKSGISSGEEEQVQSFVNMKAPLGGIYWDRSKSGDERKETVSTLTSDVTYMEANDGSELYQVDVGENTPTGFAGSPVTIYWWAKVKVVDTTDTPMESVSIKYFIQGVGGPFPAIDIITTDENGELWIEVPAYDNGQWSRFTFKANDPGGAVATSDQFRFNTNTNLDVDIEMNTVSINPDLSGIWYLKYNKYIVGGPNVEFFGAAESGGENNIVTRVVIYLGNEVLGEAKDTSAVGSPDFSSWSFTFNSELYPDDDYTFGFQVIDNAYQATRYFDIEINQEIVPHAPEILEIIVSDPDGSRSVLLGDSTDTYVNQNEKLINFKVIIFDIDHRSEFLDRGKEMEKADMRLVYVNTGEVILTKLIEEDDFRKENESGGFSFSIDIDSSNKPGTSQALDDGLYRLEFDIYDDANYWLKAQNITFDLSFAYLPNAYAYIDELDGKRLNENENKIPGVDQFDDFESFILTTDESSTLLVRFNLTRCSDQDSSKFGAGLSYQDLKMTIWYRFKGAEGEDITVADGEIGIPVINIEFDVGHVQDHEVGSFDLLIQVEDGDGLTDTVRYIVRITHDPEQEPPSVIVGIIPASAMNILNPILLILMLAVYGALLFVFFAKYHKDKKKKLEIVEKKREQDKATKADSSIDDEVSDKYMTHSKKYLEKTGGSKGKDAFAKELEAARGDGPVKSGPVTPIQQLPTAGQTQPATPPTPAPPQAQVKPPQPAQAPPMQEPPTPVAPPAPAAPTPAAPPAPAAPAPAQTPTQAPVPPVAPPAPPAAPPAPPAPPAAQPVPKAPEQ